MKYEDYIAHMNETLFLIDDAEQRAKDILRILVSIVPKGMGRKTKRWKDAVNGIQNLIRGGVDEMWKDVYRTLCIAQQKHSDRELPF